MAIHSTRRSCPVLCAAILVLSGLPLLAEEAGSENPPPASTKEAKVRRLLDLSSGGDFGAAVLKEMKGQFEDVPEGMLPPGFVDKFMEVANTDAILEMILPIWKKHLDDELIDAALVFFESPLGQRYAKATTSINSEAVSVMQKWGQEMAMEVLMSEMGDMGEGPELGELEPDEPFEPQDEESMPGSRSRIAANETAAIGTLRTLVTSQAQFQSAAIVDVDTDGTGEFGTMTELSGATGYRIGDGVSNSPVAPAFITSTLGDSAAENGGIATRAGYHFLIYLPSASGKAIADTGAIEGGNSADSNLQEMSFVCYAWPVELGATGNRAFVVSQQGEVFSSANRDFQEYSGASSVPAAGAAFDPGKSEAPDNAIGVLVSGRVGGDDNYWLPAGN